MLKHTFIFFALALLSYSTLEAQRYHENFAGRVQGGLNAAFYNADFSSTGDVVDCGQLTGGSGLNATFNGILEFPLSTSIGIGVGIG